MSKRHLSAIGALLFVLFLYGCGQQKPPAAPPGTVEDAGPVGLQAVLSVHNELAVRDDEFVIYYVRPDGSYDNWALWLWAIPGGDGGKAWDNTQQWQTKNGVGFMRFKKSGLESGAALLGPNGEAGFIVREKNSWTKDGETDRRWNFQKENACIVFSGDEHTYAVKEYKPRITAAVLETPYEVKLSLSGKYALDTDGGASGFALSSGGQPCRIKQVYNAHDPEHAWNNFTDSVVLKTAEPVSLSTSASVYHERFEGAATIDMKNLLLQTLEQTVPPKEMQLGAVYNSDTKSCLFSLWAPTSRDVSVNLYKKADSGKPDFTVPLSYDEKTGIWQGSFTEEDAEGFFYDYTLTNEQGTQTVLDPYARSMAAYTGNGGVGRGAVIDLHKKTLMPEKDYPYVTLQKREDAVLYEVSVRDFTVSPDSGVTNIPGTYSAFIEKIPYLKELGVTHIQLMPVLNFYYTDETNRRYEDAGTVQNNNYNWGYDPHNYFTPEGWYASDPENPESRVRELRELINECHKAGIGVLLDVVYNHMAKTDFLDMIVPGYYFRTGKNGSCTNGSGCGNDVASERMMARKLIVDSTVHWVQEYKADGFRFDLMGLLDTETVLEAYNRCKDINPSVLFVGEGWKMYNGASGTVGMDQQYMTKTDSVAVFNDELRDLVKAGGMNEAGRGFLTKKGPDLQRLFSNCIGSPKLNYTADSPGDNVQYLVCHDGLTLHDCIAHNAGLNETKSSDRKEIIARLKLGNALALTTQGIAFLHAGQERGRTKPNIHGASQECVGSFVRNSYDSSDSINRFIWNLAPDYAGLLNYTRGLIAVRKKFEVFRIGNAEKIAKAAAFLPLESPDRLMFGYTLDWTDGTWFLLFNAAETERSVELSREVKNPVFFADGAAASPDGIQQVTGVKLDKNRIILGACTAAVFRSE